MSDPLDIQLQFMQAEIGSCRAALDSARLELSLGEPDEARRRLEIAARGVATLERFLPLIPAEDRPAIEEQISELRSALDGQLQVISQPHHD